MVPFCSPKRIDASQEFDRTLPFQVKVSVWFWVTLFEARSMKALAVPGLIDWLVLPPPLPMPPGSPKPRPPEVRAMLVAAPTPLMSERPSQPARSLERVSPPMNVSLMLAR